MNTHIYLFYCLTILFLLSCGKEAIIKENSDEHFVVATNDCSNITTRSAILGGTLNLNNSSITLTGSYKVGFVYSYTNSYPTIDDSEYLSTNSIESNHFSVKINTLKAGCKVYYRSFLVVPNTNIVYYGETKAFSTQELKNITKTGEVLSTGNNSAKLSYSITLGKESITEDYKTGIMLAEDSIQLSKGVASFSVLSDNSSIKDNLPIICNISNLAEGSKYFYTSFTSDGISILTSNIRSFTTTMDVNDNEHNSSDNYNYPVDNLVSRIEIPHLDSRYDFICHKLSDGLVNYSMEYDKQLYHARWVAYTYDSQSAQRYWTERTNAWAPEPFYQIKKEYQISGILPNGDDQKFPGYNRGQLVGSAERCYSREANEQTFYMSNLSPMLGPFNSEYWGEIEDIARDRWGRNVIKPESDYYGGTLYIAKGGSLQATSANPNPIMSYCTVKNSNGADVKIAVPRYYFMACLFISSTGSAKAIGFWLEHKDYNNTSDAFLKELRRNAACSIDELEAKTGLDFFCNLNDNVENLVEKSYTISQWNGL